MADNRNFVNKFANEGGGDIFVEDARLSESTSTTTVTTEGLLLKGTDGAYYEIDKASLSEVIRAELGAILADNSKNNGTSVGKVPTLNSTGNALGASSVADLATVLGGEGRLKYCPYLVNVGDIGTTNYPVRYGVHLAFISGKSDYNIHILMQMPSDTSAPNVYFAIGGNSNGIDKSKWHKVQYV